MAGFQFVSPDIAVDIGTDNTRVYVKDKGIVVNEPSVVITRGEGPRNIVAVGDSAEEMIGRAGGNIRIIHPLRDGVIVDYEMAQIMIHYFVSKAIGTRRFVRPRVVVTMPGDVSKVERRAVINTMEKIGARQIFVVEQAFAAALGTGLPVYEPQGSFVVDIGGGTTDIAVISMSSAVVKESVAMAGDKVDEAITKHMRRRHNLHIGERTAERIKIQLAVVSPEPAVGAMDITGRSIISGLPRTEHIEAAEISEAVEEVAVAIIEAIHSVLERTPPELASDIYQNGIILTGGGALLGGLSRRIQTSMRIPCQVADNPADCVVRGTGMALENMELYGDLVYDYRKPGRYDFQR